MMAQLVAPLLKKLDGVAANLDLDYPQAEAPASAHRAGDHSAAVQRERKLTMLLVSHDLSAVEYACDDV